MRRVKPNRKRETRISLEVLVEAYESWERAMGWHCYLQDKLTFPFTAKCTGKRIISPLRVGEVVDVVGMAPEKECRCEVFVVTRWQAKGRLAVPLAQLEVLRGDAKTREAVRDWHYWIARGYEF